MSEWYRIGISIAILLAIALAFGLWQFNASQLRGEAWMMVTGGPFPTTRAYSLPSLTEAPLSLMPDVEFGGEMVQPFVTDASVAPDGARAFLARHNGATQVMFDDGTGARALTDTKTLKRDLVWAPDGQSLAFSEIATSTADRTNPDNWMVVRMLRTGDAVSVGNGIHPAALAGSDTAALTSQGIVSLNRGRDPKVLIAGAVTTGSTATAVSGNYIAWVNPADGSLQIFEMTATGTYTPLLVKKSFVATSLQFVDVHGLLATRTSGESTTLVYVSVPAGTEKMLGSVPGTAVLTGLSTQK